MDVGQSQFLYRFEIANDLEPMYSCIGIQPEIDTPGDLLAWAQLAYEHWRDRVLPYQSINLNFTGVIAQHRFASGIVEQTYADLEVGGRSGNMLTQNTAYLIHKYTGGTGRGKHGRMYVPGVPDDKVANNGDVAGAEVDTWNVGLSDMLGDFPDAFLVVNHVSGPGAGTFDPITSLELDGVVATQRRRLRR